VLVIVVSEFVIGVMIAYFAYPSYSDYLIGKGYAISIITPYDDMKIVTVLGDKI